MTPTKIISATGIQQAYMLQRYIADRYEVDLSVGEAWSMVDELPKHSYDFDVALSGQLNERGHFDCYGQTDDDNDKLDEIHFTTTLHMPWNGEPFDDAQPEQPQVARSKIFRSMNPITPVNSLAALVAGER